MKFGLGLLPHSIVFPSKPTRYRCRLELENVPASTDHHLFIVDDSFLTATTQARRP